MLELDMRRVSTRNTPETVHPLVQLPEFSLLGKHGLPRFRPFSRTALTAWSELWASRNPRISLSIPFIVDEGTKRMRYTLGKGRQVCAAGSAPSICPTSPMDRSDSRPFGESVRLRSFCATRHGLRARLGAWKIAHGGIQVMAEGLGRAGDDASSELSFALVRSDKRGA